MLYFYTQWNFSQPQKGMKFCHLQVNGWNWRTSSYEKLARLRGPKLVCFPSYADFRAKTNVVILLDMGHMLRGECIQEDREREGNLKLESVCCAYRKGVNKVILN
jgi:hypothetical protein